MTHRQFEAWREWLFEEWNKPSRTDHYLMQITAEVVRTPGRWWGKLPKVKLDDFRIPFVEAKPTKPFVKRPGGPPAPLTKEEVIKFRASMRAAQIKAAGVQRLK